MKHHITNSLQADALQVTQASGLSDSDPVQVENTPATVLRGLSSTAVAALFGCAAHLLQMHNRLERTATTIPSKLRALDPEPSLRLRPPGSVKVAHVNALQQPGHAQGNDTDMSNADQGRAQAADDADEDGDVDVSNAVQGHSQPEGMQDLVRQVAWLTQLVQLPWQMQPGEAQADDDRSALLALVS